MVKLSTLELEGFKSISHRETITFGNVNLLIGANGAGKSNLISFFQLLSRLMRKDLQFYIQQQGGADTFLSHGQSQTQKISAKLKFGMNGYFFDLAATTDGKLIFEAEKLWFAGVYYSPTTKDLGRGHSESKAPDQLDGGQYKSIAQYVVPTLRDWRVYHFHDTGDTAPAKRLQDINDNETLRGDASNIAAFLFRMQEENKSNYEAIRDSIRLVAPFFGDFALRPTPANKQKIQLEWNERGSDFPFRGQHLSDGTLRFICLATLLLQPRRPSTIIIDEPELGLHPYAIVILASIFRSVAEQGTQIIASTQSVPLLNEFEPDDILVVDRVAGATTFRRFSQDELDPWLEEYSMGEIWQKNIIGGKPAR
jgi:predicted ATPase